ncbi:MAG: lactonase family protein [Spirochaetaceae bacterium]
MAREAFFVGSYTIVDDWMPNAAGEGISRLELDCATGRFGAVEPVARLGNPSYLALSPDGSVLLACSELFHEDGKVWTLVADSDGGLRPVSERTSMGRATCHVSFDPARNRVFASSYLDGRVVGYDADGAELLGGPVVLEYEGEGPNRDRQESSHPHQVVVRGDSYFVPDLGADRVWIHHAEEPGAVMRASVETPAGCGPRHLCFHPSLTLMYVVCELKPRVLVYEQSGADGDWALVEDHECELPALAGVAAPGAIKLHPSGRMLTVSNRFSNSLQQFSIDTGSGRLSAGRNVSLAGKTPRDFTFSSDGRRLIALCQDTNEAFSYSVDPETGVMEEAPTDRVEMGTPVCIIAAAPPGRTAPGRTASGR